jgi:hypothetical protein
MLLEQRSDGCREGGTALDASPDGQESRLPITFGARIATSGVRQPAPGQVGGQAPGWDMSKGWFGGFFARQQAQANNPSSVDTANRASSIGAPTGVMGKVGSITSETQTKGVEGGDSVSEGRGWESLASGAPPSPIKAAGLLNSGPLRGPASAIGAKFPFASAFLSRCEAERITPQEAMVLVKRAMNLDPLIKAEFTKLAEMVETASPLDEILGYLAVEERESAMAPLRRSLVVKPRGRPWGQLPGLEVRDPRETTQPPG